MRRSSRQIDQNLHSSVRKKHKISHHKTDKNSKICDTNKKEKSKNKKRNNANLEISKVIDENVDIGKKSPKLDIDYSIPMVVVEKMDFANVSKSSDIFNANEIQNKALSEVNMIKEEISNNVIPESTKIDIIQSNVDDIVFNPLNEHVDKKDIKNKKHKLENEEDQTKKVATKIEKQSRHKHDKEKNKRKVKHHDIRKAPELDVKAIKTEEILPPPEINVEIIPAQVIPKENNLERVAIKIKLCNSCNTRHLQDACPLRNPLCIIQDSITLECFNQKHFDENVDNDKNVDDIDLQISMDSEDNSLAMKREFESFSVQSLPSIFYLEESDSAHGLSVFTKCEIKEYTQVGPVIGKIIKEVDIPEDFGMKNLWEVRFIKC